MILNLRPFDTVEGMGFNVLFKSVPNPFSSKSQLFRNSFENPGSFENPESFENPDKFENLKIFRYSSRSRKNFVFLIRPDISGSHTPLTNRTSRHTSNPNAIGNVVDGLKDTNLDTFLSIIELI